MSNPRKSAISELKRELSQRKKVYPRLIQSQKLHRDHANRQYLRVKEVIHVLESMSDAHYNDYLQRWKRAQDATPPPSLFS